jgi:hypothetical protein
LNRLGIKKLRTLAAEPDEGAMLRFPKQKTFKNYRELLAKERSETERMFILKVLARKGGGKPPPLSARPMPAGV